MYKNNNNKIIKKQQKTNKQIVVVEIKYKREKQYERSSSEKTHCTISFKDFKVAINMYATADFKADKASKLE